MDKIATVCGWNNDLCALSINNLRSYNNNKIDPLRYNGNKIDGCPGLDQCIRKKSQVEVYKKFILCVTAGGVYSVMQNFL